MKQVISTLDLESVLIPEIWVAVGQELGIPELCCTTREEADYEKLMRNRLAIVEKHDLRFSDLLNVVNTLRPLPEAIEFLRELRSKVQVIILSDTFEQFASPLLSQLGWPTLLCHRLVIENDRLVGFRLRIPDQKRRTVEALQQLNYKVIAVGDSLNDVSMLCAAEVGILLNAPESLNIACPQLQAAAGYSELMALIMAHLE